MPDSCNDVSSTLPSNEEGGSSDALITLSVRVVLSLAVFFFIVSLAQLSYLHWTLQKATPSGVPETANLILDNSLPDNLEGMQLSVAAKLESEAISRRHENAHITQMGHLWIRYLGSVTGMIMATIGSVFILARVSLPSASEFVGEVQSFKFTLASASPGLFLVVLGTAMMTISVISQHSSAVTDGALYAPFEGSRLGAGGTFVPPPQEPVLD